MEEKEGSLHIYFVCLVCANILDMRWVRVYLAAAFDVAARRGKRKRPL